MSQYSCNIISNRLARKVKDSDLRVDVDAERGEVRLQADAGRCQRAGEVNEALSGSGHTGRTVDYSATVRFGTVRRARKKSGGLRQVKVMRIVG